MVPAITVGIIMTVSQDINTVGWEGGVGGFYRCHTYGIVNLTVFTNVWLWVGKLFSQGSI